jgi:serine/threonine-protein kinase
MFEIERLIAEGGMGEVYKGVSVASGDAVAIKLVRPEMARNPDVMALFKREAAILHTLLHDAIPRYYVFSVEPELQRAYIAMEFVDGVSLQKRLASGPLSAAEVRVLLKRIGGALELAHASGVVHRDISSDNIILPGGDPRRAKIVDFGIARDAQASEGTIIGGGFAGKYKYVSPEQLGLFGGVATAKSDIYSFGLVLAEALRGRPIDMGSTQAEVIEKRKRVPDLSDIDNSLRPLLTAMLAPNPDERPASMAEVAAWGETGERTQVTPAPRPPARKSGAVAAVVAAAVLIAVAAAGYLLRDRLREAISPPIASLPSPSPSASPAKLPPLPPSTASPTPTAASAPPTPSLPPPPTAAAASPSPAPTLAPTPFQGETPSKQALLEQLPPRAPQDEIALKAVTVGAPVREELPAFVDPGGKGLALHATAPLPPGLALHDLGGGRSVLEGAASAAGRFAFEVVAINHNGQKARMKVTLEATQAPPAAPAPPAPAQSAVQLEPAKVGAPYSAGLPPFRSPEKLSLRAERLPEGLVFADLGGGLSQLSGAPAKAGSYAFDIVAIAPGGAEGRMTVHLDVAPAPPPPTPTSSLPRLPPPTQAAEPAPAPSVAPAPSAAPAPSVAPAPSTPVASERERVAQYLSAHGAGPCFLARFEDKDSDPLRFVGLGEDRAAFERFEADFKRAFARDPDVRAELVTKGQCPVVELMKQPAASAAPPPRLVLDSVAVGAGQPLSGAVTELANRKLVLVAIGDDGRAVKVRAEIAGDGQSASFNLGLSGDAASFGKPQLLLAVASDRPLADLESFRAGPSGELMRRLETQWRQAGAAAALAMFKLVN